MKKILLLSLMTLSPFTLAEIIKSPIHSIEDVPEMNLQLLKFENGRVAFINQENKSFSPMIQLAQAGDVVEAKVDSDSNLMELKTLEVSESGPGLMNLHQERPKFDPTIIPSLAEAQKIFKRLNQFYTPNSECSNRAHVWAWEEFKNHGIKSLKAWIFFTASYITRNRTKWWFHVAPMIMVKHNGKIEGRVLDYRYSHGPVTYKEWSDPFVFSKRPCKPTTKFSEYDVNPQTEDCYQMIEPMYYWVPKDIHNHELINRYKTDFSQGEIRASYSQAFYQVRNQ